MLLVMLFGLVVLSLLMIDVLAYLPLAVMRWLHPSTWLITLLWVGFAWCLGDD